jgi:outer membrane protein assembly factor BamB/tetratricopeptide (TPR) repeat protein
VNTIKNYLFLIFLLSSLTLFSQTPGTKKWEYLTGSYIYSSPAIGAEGIIYVGSNDYKLYAINPDGTKKWEFLTGGYIYSSPAIGSDGTIYVGSYDKKLYAVNPDGTKKWEYLTGGYIYSSPTIGSDGTIYVGSYDYKLYAINPDGTKKWEFLTGSYIYYSSPAIGPDGTIYVGSYDYKLYAINPNGTKKWEYLTGSYIYSSPAIGDDGTIYVGSYDKKLYAIKPDGIKKWEYVTGGYVYSSPAIDADGTIYVGSYDYKLYAINAGGTKKWEFLTGGYLYYSSPAIGADGTIYIGSYDRKLYAINTDGTKKWEYLTGGILNYSSPAIGTDGTIYVGSYDYKLNAIFSSSNGLVSSSWPKYKHDNFNKGQLTNLVVSNIDFTNMVLPNLPYNFKINLFSNYNKNITITNIHINDVDFGLLTTLPVTIVPGTNQEVSLALTEPKNKWYKPRLSIDYTHEGTNNTRVYNMEGFVFLDDNSELAHTANQVMSVWKTLNKNNEILLNNTKGVIYRLLSDYPAAQASFNIALSRAINARYSYSGIMMNTGVVRSDRLISDSANVFYASALKVIQTTATSSVLAPQIYYNQAWEAYSNANYTSASTLALQTINHSMSNAYLKAKAYTLLGAIRFSQVMINEAKDAFNQAITLDPNGPIGAMARANLQEIINTGIDQNIGSPAIRLYPNPSGGQLVISIDNLPGILNISVFNSVGAIVFSTQVSSSDYSSQNLDLSHLVDGVYFIRIASGDLVFTEKIVIIKK